jgi:hypothetical protein
VAQPPVKVSKEDAETELLKLEYLKLKQTLNQLKHTGSSITTGSFSVQQADRRREPQTMTHRHSKASIERVNDLAKDHILIQNNHRKHLPTSTSLNEVVASPKNHEDELAFSNEKLVIETRREVQPRKRLALNDDDELSHSPPLSSKGKKSRKN